MTHPPKPLIELVQSHTQGVVADDVHLATRFRVLEARAPGRWRSILPFFAGAAVVLLVILGVGFDRRHPKTQPAVEVEAPVTLDTAAVIAKIRPELKACYQAGLDEDPSMQGKVVIEAKLDAAGVVLSSTVLSNEGLSAAVGACLASAVRTAHFDGTGKGATVHIPVTFRMDPKP